MADLKRIWDLDQEIKNKNKELKELRAERDLLFQEACDEGEQEDGKYELKKVAKKTSHIPAKKFYEIYPDLFFDIVSVPKTAAEKILGKKEVSGILVEEESEGWKLIERDWLSWKDTEGEVRSE